MGSENGSRFYSAKDIAKAWAELGWIISDSPKKHAKTIGSRMPDEGVGLMVYGGMIGALWECHKVLKEIAATQRRLEAEAQKLKDEATQRQMEIDRKSRSIPRNPIADGYMKCIRMYRSCAGSDDVLGDLLSTSITSEKLDLSTRALNCLESNGVLTIGDLVSKTDSDLMEYKWFGVTTLCEVERKLARLGLVLRPQVGSGSI